MFIQQFGFFYPVWLFFRHGLAFFLKRCLATLAPRFQSTDQCWVRLCSRGEHGQDQDWISCRLLSIFLDQDWIWIFIFEKNWIRTGSGYLFDFHNEIFLRVIQDVTNDGAAVFLGKIFIFTKKSNWFCQYVLHPSLSMIIRFTSS